VAVVTEETAASGWRRRAAASRGCTGSHFGMRRPEARPGSEDDWQRRVAVQSDVAKGADWTSYYAAVSKSWKIDVLFVNAGSTNLAPFDVTTTGCMTSCLTSTPRGVFHDSEGASVF